MQSSSKLAPKKNDSRRTKKMLERNSESYRINELIARSHDDLQKRLDREKAMNRRKKYPTIK